MKRVQRIFTIVGLIVLIQNQISAKTITIPVDSIFNSLASISEIRIIGYVGDSIMNYIDLGSGDILELECKWKKYSESSIKIRKEVDPDYNSLEGAFPKIGEKLTMLTYEYGDNRILFAKKESGFYRFWDPASIPFANSVFFVPKEGIYKPTEICKKNNYQTDKEFLCSDGFMIEENDFEKLEITTENPE